MITDAAWVTGRVPGEGGATAPLESSRAVSVPCHRGPWCPGSCSSPEPVFPPVLVLASAGESGVQEKAGMLPGPEAALGQSWNVGVTPSPGLLWMRGTTQHLRLHLEAALVVLALLLGS